MTALEAMTMGLPVVASNRGALPEVLGDAGILVDPIEPRGAGGSDAPSCSTIPRLRASARGDADAFARASSRGRSSAGACSRATDGVLRAADAR